MALRWLIYGAYGYSGKLIAHQAKKRGYQPILAGRNEDALEPVARHLAFQYKAFSLDSIDEVKKQLEDVDLVINCAGPFSQTAAPLIQACIDTKTHYLDITGEIDVFEYAHSMDKAAREAGIVICPGVGFDVIPTDCTAKTSIERLGRGGAARINGQITDVPHAWHSRWIDFGNGEKCAMTIPWGDVSTAYYTTEIPNIEVYIPASPRLVKKMRRMNWFRWVFNWKWVQAKLKKKLESQPAGPEEKERKNNPTYVWGEITDGKGNKKSMRVKVKNGYSLTAEGAVELAIHTLSQKQSGGFYTPSRLYGAKLLDQFTIQ